MTFALTEVKAKVIRYEVSRSKLQNTKIKDACSELGYTGILFAQAMNLTTIDCMKQKISARDYCLKVGKENNKLVRAFVDKKNELVVCQSGHNVLLTVSCEKEHLKYCSQSSKKGCQQLQPFFAMKHKLVHYSILRDGDVHHLHCYYSGEDLTGL